MSDSTTGDLDLRVARAICNACDGPCEIDKNCICGENQRARAQAALKAHAEWLAERGLVVVPKDDRTTAEVWSELPRAIAKQEDQHHD